MVKQLFFRSGIYFVGLIKVKLLSTLLFIILARLLLPHLFGRLTYFFTLLSLVTLVSDWGMIQWFMVHRTPENEEKLIDRVTQARFFTFICSLALFGIFSFVFRQFTLTESLLFVSFLFPESFMSVVDGYYLVRHRSMMIALKQFFKYLGPLIFVFLFSGSYSLLGVMFSFLLSSWITMMWYVPKQFYQFTTFSFGQIKQTLKESSTYATLLFTSAIYSRGDTLLLGTQLGSSAVGLYSAGYRYLDAMSMFPTALSQNLFHLSARQHFTKQTVLTMVATMSVIGLLFGGFLYFFSNILTVGLLGQAYAQSEVVVRIFGVVTVLLFINSPLSTLVQSSTLVKEFIPWGILNTFLNIALNIVVIPIAGVVGAAFVMLFTETTGLLINLYFVRRRLRLT